MKGADHDTALDALPAVAEALRAAHAGDASPEAFRLRYPQQMALIAERLKLPPAEEIYAPDEARLAVRPRLFFGRITLDELRRRAADPRYAEIVQQVHASAARAAGHMPPEKVDLTAHDPNRSYADSLATMAMSVQLDADPVRRAHTLAGLLAWIHALERWGPFQNNLPLAQSTIGLSLVYDWLHDALTPADLALVRRLIIAQVRFSLDETRGGLTMWRGQRFAANHNWAQHSARAFAALALWGDADAPLAPGELRHWLDDAVVDFWIAKHTHVTDGAPLEGPSYQDYALRFYVDFITQTEGLLQMRESFFDEHVRALSARLFTLLPGNQGAMVYADGYPTRTWGVPSHFRSLAAHFQDGRFQLLANLLSAGDHEHPRVSWRDLFAYDPDLAPARLEDLPLAQDMTDFGLYTARSSWSAGAAFFGLRCGPVSGESVAHTFGFDFGEAHLHPNEGDVTFYVGSRPVLPGCEYAAKKLTSNHSLVLFEGRAGQAGREVGQLGEGGAWFNAGAQRDPDLSYDLRARAARVLATTHAGGRHEYLCDLGGLYRLQDERVPGGVFFPDYLRSVVFLADGTVAVVDRVRVPVPRSFTFRLLTAATDLARDAQGFHFTIGRFPARITDFSPAVYARQVRTEDLATIEPAQRAVASLQAEAVREATFAVVLGVGDATERYRIVTDAAGYTLTDHTGKIVLRRDWPP